MPNTLPIPNANTPLLSFPRIHIPHPQPAWDIALLSILWSTQTLVLVPLTSILSSEVVSALEQHHGHGVPTKDIGFLITTALLLFSALSLLTIPYEIYLYNAARRSLTARIYFRSQILKSLFVFLFSLWVWLGARGDHVNRFMLLYVLIIIGGWIAFLPFIGGVWYAVFIVRRGHFRGSFLAEV